MDGDAVACLSNLARCGRGLQVTNRQSMLFVKVSKRSNLCENFETRQLLCKYGSKWRRVCRFASIRVRRVASRRTKPELAKARSFHTARIGSGLSPTSRSASDGIFSTRTLVLIALKRICRTRSTRRSNSFRRTAAQVAPLLGRAQDRVSDFERGPSGRRLGRIFRRLQRWGCGRYERASGKAAPTRYGTPN